MRKIILSLVVVLAGCSIPRAPDSGRFFSEEVMATQQCVAPLAALKAEDIYKVSATTGRSPTTNSVQCYAEKMRWIASSLNYPHHELIGRYTDYLLSIANMRDRGEVTTESALSSFGQAKRQFKEAITAADERISLAGRHELKRRLGVFAGQMGTMQAQQDAINAANRPVFCNTDAWGGSSTTVCQ